METLPPMTRLIALLGFLSLVAFCVFWWRGALFIGGVVLLWLAAVRLSNERKAVRR